MKVYLSLLVCLLVSCTASQPHIASTETFDHSNSPAPTLDVNIDNLSVCIDSGDRSVSIDPNQPVTVLVHGCKGSAGKFKSLAELYAFHGQQAICYSYDDRKSLVHNAEKLSLAVSELSEALNDQKISIVGHSMGGLIARKSVEKGFSGAELLEGQELDLVTVSAPFSGIQSANTCGSRPLHWLSVGIVPGICWMVTGDNWFEITASSNFIKQPKPLLPAIGSYLKVVTDERNTCRRQDAQGNCIESDYVFDVAEQKHPEIDNYSNVTGVTVNAGHVEIVGDNDTAPRKLITVLQNQGMFPYTPLEQVDAFEKLLADLY